MKGKPLLWYRGDRITDSSRGTPNAEPGPEGVHRAAPTPVNITKADEELLCGFFSRRQVSGGTRHQLTVSSEISMETPSWRMLHVDRALSSSCQRAALLKAAQVWPGLPLHFGRTTHLPRRTRVLRQDTADTPIHHHCWNYYPFVSQKSLYRLKQSFCLWKGWGLRVTDQLPGP